jgi:hypothetical protein
VNKGVIWEKVWSHPLVFRLPLYFSGRFKVSSLNAREALLTAATSRCTPTGKSRVPIFPKCIW